MKDNIDISVGTWDWKCQSVGGEKISNIISRIERGVYKTKEIELQLDCIDLSTYRFDCDDLFEFMVHYEMVRKSELKYPIIVNNRGQIIDGRHRLCKAILEGKKTIKGIMITDDEVLKPVENET